MTATARSVLHIIAHQDDDLYFMNPDLIRSLRDGDQVTTVVVTAGRATASTPTPATRAAPGRRRTTPGTAPNAAADYGPPTPGW